MKILITGSSGMLGTELCRTLREDHELVGLDISAPRDPDIGPKAFYEIGIDNTEELKKVFGKEKPELVLHAAAWTDVDGCEKDPEKAYRINAAGTGNIAAWAGRAGARVILISTDFVFDGRKGSPYTEDDEPFPLGVYGRTKREAEIILQKEVAESVIVRTSWLYGTAGKNFVDTIVSKGRAGERLKVVEDQTGSPTYARDLAGALAALVGMPSGSGQGVFHVSNSGYCSWYAFASRILREAGMGDVTVDPITSAELDRPAPRPLFSALDSTRFTGAAGMEMRPWDEALADYMKERYGG